MSHNYDTEFLLAYDKVEVQDVCTKLRYVLEFLQYYSCPNHDTAPVSSLWPFYKWGVDIVGPLALATGQRKFILVATDYFIKRVKAEA